VRAAPYTSWQQPRKEPHHKPTRKSDPGGPLQNSRKEKTPRPYSKTSKRIDSKQAVLKNQQENRLKGGRTQK